MKILQDAPKLDDLDVIFLDTGGHACEGFTNGLLLIVKDIMTRLQSQGKKVGILSVVDKNASLMFKGQKIGLHSGMDDHIPVFEYLIDGDFAEHDKDILFNTLKNTLGKTRPALTLMTTPAVFLSENDVLCREAANRYSGKVVHILADNLFPTYSDPRFEKEHVKKLYEEIKRGEVIGLTKNTQQKFLQETGIASKYYKNPFNLNDILVPPTEDKTKKKYITMINTHPIKGIAIFDKVARMMPDQNFMVVKNWPDVPDYTPPPNMIVKEFIKKPKDIYKDTKILLVPSLHEDGPTRVAVEALANGIPVIASKIGSIPEFGEGNYVLVPPPKIYGYNLDGTVLYPKMTHSDVEKVAAEYCKNIRDLLESKDFFRKYTQTPQQNALAYIKEADNVLNEITNGWMKEIDSKDFISLTDANGKKYTIPENKIPQAIKDVGLPFEIDIQKLWNIDVKPTELPVSDLIWHLDMPFWPDDKIPPRRPTQTSKPLGISPSSEEQNMLFSTTPNEVLKDPNKHRERYQRIQKADTSYPISVVYFKGKPLILDGLHRLSKSVMTGKETVSVKIVPPERLKEIAALEDTLSSFDMGTFNPAGEFANKLNRQHILYPDLKSRQQTI